MFDFNIHEPETANDTNPQNEHINTIIFYWC